MSMTLFAIKALVPLPHKFIKTLSHTCRSKTMASSWSCKQCTFLNPPSQKSTCQVCLSPLPLPPLQSSSSSSSSAPKWSCKACTFLNPYNRPTCELCDTRAPASSLSSFDDLTDTAPDFAVLETSVFFPLRPCKKSRLSDSDSTGSHVVVNDSDSVVTQLGVLNDSDSAVTQLEEDGSGIGLKTLKILSYNVWFREDLELRKRMKALGDLIEIHSPDIICFQEVTPEIYRIFQQSSWWKVYDCSVSKQMPSIYFCMQLSKLTVKSFSTVPFRNSEMGRELCVAEIQVEKDMPLTIATSHLESPCPAPPTWNQMYSKERVEQAKEAIGFLKKHRNVVFAGDMNWDDKLDGKFPLPDDDWIDAWTKLRPEENGWTYDTKSNKMLSGNRSLQKRLDRFVCKLNDFDISRIEMIGMDAIPGISYIKEKKVKNEVKRLELPVLPSDHYGLLLTICSR